MKTFNRFILSCLLFFVAPIAAFAAATNVSTMSISSTPANVSTGYVVGEVVRATVVFTAAETVTVTGGTPSLKLDVGGNIRTATYTSGSGTVNLIFSYTIVPGDVDADGITVVANSLATNGGSITNGGTAATLPHGALVTANTADKVASSVAALDTTAPIFRSAVASGATITLTYDEIGSGLKATPTPATDRFAFSRTGGSALSITEVTINHTAQTVSLKLSGLINFTDTDLKVSYTANGTNDLQDVAGNTVANLSTVYVANVMPIFDAQGNHFAFNSPTPKVGNGTNVGDKILYNNVINVDGQDIDAIVTTVAKSSGTTILSADGLPTGSTQADKLTGTSTVDDNNWYKLHLNPTGTNGYVKLKFDFIKSGTYSTPEYVTLQNVIVNSYDIDNCNNCQYQEFGGFSSYALASNTTLTPTATVDKLTRFTTATSGNVQTGPGSSAGDQIRVMALYETISSFEIKVGQPSSSQAFFYLDFSQGPNWNSTYKEYKNPTVNPRVTNDTTPDLTGTFVGTVASYTDTVWKLEVMVNGVTYTASTRNDSGNTATITGNGLTGTFDKITGVGNWYITIPTALQLGTYDVVAKSYFGANLAAATKITADDTTNELVINNVDPPDTTNPTLISFERLNPLNATITHAGLAIQNYVDFKATFSEAVTNVDRTDFQITGTASTGLSIASAVQSSTTSYTVRISNIPTSTLGTLNLDLATRQDIVDLAGNLLTIIIPTGNDETYDIVTSVPAGITVTPTSGLITTEAGGTATFTVKLNSQPTANVTIGLHSSNIDEGNIAPNSLTFTPYDWNSPKTVTVTGVDDAIVDGNVSYSIVTDPANSSDVSYNNRDAADVAVTNNDNDTAPAPTVTLAVNNANIAEAAGISTITVTLSAAATEVTTVTIAATGTATSSADYTLSSNTITIAAGQTTGTATITAVQDDVDENNETVIVDITGVSGGTGATESGTQQQTVTIIDDDTAGITVNPTSGLITTEAGGVATFTVQLNSQPTADVTINLSSSNTTEGMVSPSSLTFTSGNWNTTQTVTVTGVDDVIVDGNIGYAINLAASSGGYNGINASVSVTNKALPVATNDVETYAPGLPKIINVLANDTSDNTIVATSVSIVGGTDSNSDGVNEQIIIANEGTWTVNTPTGTITFTPQGNFIGNPTPISYTVKDALSMTSNAATVALTATCTANIGSFSGTVWNDVNYNNTLDTGEALLANVPVTLVPQGTTSGPTQIRVTGTDGTFNFAAATAGAYLLQVQDANLNAARHLYPTSSSLYFTSIATCEHKTKNYGYAPTQYPVLGDLIWYDVNANGLQDDWFDANNDNQVTKNDPNALTNMADWEWIDLNGDDSFIGAANEGELNKCGFGQAINNNGNVWVTNTTTNAIKKVIVGIQGYWRTRPDYGTYNVALNLTADGGALSNAAQAMAATGKCKAIASPRLRKGEEKMLSEATLICAPTGGAAGNVTLADPGTGNPQPERLDIDFGIECRANQAPIAVDMTNAAPLLLSDGPTTIDALTGTDSDGSVVSITIITTPAAAQGTLFMSNGTTAVTDNQVLTVAEAASLKFDPSGTFVGNSTFTFEVTDNDGAISTNTATATVSIIAPPGITVTPTSDLITTEAGGAATFTVKLNSQPAGYVTIGLSSSDTTEGTVAPASVTFTASNWNTPQTVTITGVDDAIVDGDIAYSIITAVLTSIDRGYLGIDPDDVTVTNTDDGDIAAGITVTPVNGLTTTEAGGTASFTVVLTSHPSGSANVMIGLSSSDNTEGSVSTSSLNFTDTTWNIPKTVTVTGLDDGIIDANVGYSINLEASGGGYDGVIATANVTNTNDDILPAPGGVAGYLKLWLKANAGISTINLSGNNQAVSSWVSQSFNQYTARAVNTQTSPLFINNATDSINFNPIVRFNSNSLVTGIANGTTNGLNLGSNYLYSTNAGITMFAMLHAHPTQTTAKPVLDFGNATTYGYGFGYGNDALYMYTPTSAGSGGVNSGNIALTHDLDPVIFTARVTFQDTQKTYLNDELINNANIPNLRELTAGNINAAATYQATSGPVTIGRRSNTTSSFFAGKIPEIIVYTNVLTDVELNKVQSYLALKYGITLETDYLASDGSTIRAVHDGYDFDIAGIGRDDDTGLLQLKSKSSNASGLVTMAIDSLRLGTDKSFLIWGDNGIAATYSLLGGPADKPSLQIMGKTWKVTNIGNVGTVTITSSDTTAKSLLLDNDGNFTTGSNELILDAGGSIANVALTEGIYFTLARPIPPGPAVTTGGYSAVTITSDSVLGNVKPNGTDGININICNDMTRTCTVNSSDLITRGTGVSANVKFEYGLTSSYGNTKVAIPATITPALETVLITNAAKLSCKCTRGAALTTAITAIAATFKTPVQANLTNLTCNTQYHYRVVAENSVGGTGTGEDRTFSTAACPPPAIVDAPTAGAIWKRLTTNTIRWSWFTGTQVKIVLYKGGSIHKTLASVAVNSGNFNWSIPSSQLLGSDYYFRVSSVTTPTQYADSGVFTINPEPPPPVVTYPNNTGIIWQRATINSIKWSDFPGLKVRIYLYKGGSLNRTLANPAVNTGDFNWAVPTTQAVGTNYKIRVQAVDTGAYDESNNFFSIQ